ncbi:MAG: 50S ribosomal protein L3 [Methanotrichaceae archaeon]|nr:50S ribosomal protein L3 [Methanotrichaceae archaeon]
MAKVHRPRRGSLAFSPRKRAKSEVPRIRSWAEADKPKIAGFAGYKAGMTHIMMLDDRQRSLTEGMEISMPVTVLEAPPMNIVAIRAYESFNGGLRSMGEAWADNLSPVLSRAITIPKKAHGISSGDLQSLSDEIAEIRILVHTSPILVTGIPKKIPDIMEMPIIGGTIVDQVKLAQGLLSQQFSINDVFEIGDLIDVTSVTKGKGTQGPVKRWGIAIQKRKHARTGKKRHVGNLGPWHPARVSWRIPQLGQTGYQQRTEYNKRLMMIGADGSDITPKGGFPGYGLIRNQYVLLKGSLPGPVKRLVRMKKATRPGLNVVKAPELLYVSRESKQGLR